MIRSITKPILLGTAFLFLLTSSFAGNNNRLVESKSSQQKTTLAPNVGTELTQADANFNDPNFIAFAQNSRKNVVFSQLSDEEKARLWNDYQAFLNGKVVKSNNSANKAQILFQDFSNGIPSSWTTRDVDGGTPAAPSLQISTWDTITDPGNAANIVAVSNSWLSPIIQNDDWLITPAVTIDSASTLFWDAAAQDPAFPDGYEVRISTTDTAIASFLANPPLFSIAAENPGPVFTSRSVDLAAAGYTNQTVYFAFRNNSTDQFWLLLDNVEVQDAATTNDVAIAGGLPRATGIAGYTEMPVSQVDSNVAFLVEVANLADASTGLNLTGTINPGAANVSGTSASIDTNQVINILTNTFGANTNASYTADFAISINETDVNPNNDSLSFSFNTGSVSDTIYARESATVSNVNLGFTGGSGRFGNLYDINSTDTLTSITVYFGGDPAGKTFELFVGQLNGAGDVYTTGPISGLSGVGFYTIDVGGVVLTPGEYLIGVNQTGTVNIAVGLTTSVFYSQTAFFGGYGAWSAIESIGNPAFNGAFMVRPNFGPAPVNILSNFNLGFPPDGTRLDVTGIPSTEVDITWDVSTSSIGDPVSYEWLLDLPGGDFTNPLAVIPSNNAGADTALTLTFAAIDGLLGALGVPVGDSVDASWTVRATSTAAILGSLDTFDIRLVRSGLGGSRDFEAYNAGDLIVANDPEWAFWPGGNVDAPVSTAQAQSGTNSLFLDGVANPAQDLLFLLGDQTTGTWGAGFSMFVPNGSSAYYNIQETQSTGVNWVIGNVTFDDQGNGTIDGYTPAINFTYPQGQWFDVRHYIDLDNDSIQIFIDGNYVWASAYTAAAGGATQLGAFNIFPPGAPSAVKTYYLDDMYFQTDTLRTIPAPPHDAALNSGAIVASGLAGHALVPPSQNDPSGFSLGVNNLGDQPITAVTVNGTINPGSNSVSGSLASINAFGSGVVTTSGFSANQGATYTGAFSVSIAETDANPTNDNAGFNFTAGAISDTVFARENATTNTNAVGLNGTGRLGNMYEFTANDTISSISIFFPNAPADTFRVFVSDFNFPANNSTTVIYESGPVNAVAGFNTWSVNIPVTPGRYMVGVNQTTTNNIGLGLDGNTQRLNTTFFGNLSGWTDIVPLGGTLAGTFMVRLGLGITNQPIALSPFSLTSPPDGTRLVVQGGNNNPVTITWDPSTPTPAAPVTYRWLLDVQGGDFSNPLLAFPSDNGGADPQLTLTSGAIDAELANLGINPGDSVDVIWTAEATAGATTALAANGPFDIRLVRDATHSLRDNVLAGKVKFYPNPSNGELIIEVEDDLVESVVIQNMVGQSLKTFDNVSSRNVIDLSDLSSGLYLVKFISGNGEYSQKLVIE